MNWPISWQNVKDHIDDIEDGINPELLPKGGFGYSEPSTIVVIPKGSYEINNGMYEAQTTQFPNEGDLITLTLDGAVYSKAAKSAVIEDGKVVYIGNDSAVGLEDTGENYFAGFLPDIGAVYFAIMSESLNEQTTTHTVEVSFAGQTIVPIAPQYMPCVSLETVIDGETNMSEADAAKLDALAAVGLPAVIKLKFSGNNSLADVAVWCSCIKADGAAFFKCYMGRDGVLWTVTFTNVDGVWKGIPSNT